MISFSLSDAAALSVLIITSTLALQYRSFKAVIFSLILLISWQSVSIILSYAAKRKQLLTVYSIKKENVLSIKNKTMVVLNNAEKAAFNFHVKPQLVSFNYPHTKTKHFNFCSGHGQTVLVLDKPGNWPQADISKVTVLVLANNFLISESDLAKLLNLSTVVVQGTNNMYSRKKTEQLCRKFRLEFYDTVKDGAYLMPLD